jgi:hypothetical protein
MSGEESPDTDFAADYIVIIGAIVIVSLTVALVIAIHLS